MKPQWDMTHKWRDNLEKWRGSTKKWKNTPAADVEEKKYILMQVIFRDMVVIGANVQRLPGEPVCKNISVTTIDSKYEPQLTEYETHYDIDGEGYTPDTIVDIETPVITNNKVVTRYCASLIQLGRKP